MTTVSLPAKAENASAKWCRHPCPRQSRRAGARRACVCRSSAGLATIGIGLGSFTAWAFTARLDSAAVAAGTVIVDSRRKTVSHLEGGILQRLMVEEGDVVTAGQSLLRLDTTRARSDMEQLRGRRAGLLARLARLRAEQARAPDMQPEAASDDDTPFAADAVRAERNLMLARRETYQRKLSIQLNQIEQQAAESEAAAAQIVANARQLELLRADLECISGLVAEGFARRTQLTEMLTRRERADRPQCRAGGAQDQGRAGQGRCADRDPLTRYGTAAASRGRHPDDAARSCGNHQRLAAARDVLRRLEVVSPQAGVVANIRMRTRAAPSRRGSPCSTSCRSASRS